MISHYVDSRVLALVSSTGCPLLTYFDAITSGKVNAAMLFTMGMAAGYYDSQEDYIGLNERALESDRVNEVVLHELIHWTGHPSRLNRNTITSQLHGMRPTSYDYHTEEATAQMGMFKLACLLGLDKELHLMLLNVYLTMFPEANLAKADWDSNQAVGYLLDLAKYNHREAA